MKPNEGFELEPFQEIGINNVAKKLSTLNSVLAVSPGGSGKGIIIATIAYRFIQKSDKDVTILVHKGELLDQIRKHLLRWYNVISQKIDSNTNIIDKNARVFVGMVETFDRRSSKTTFLDYFKNTGLLIFDEAHLTNFNKIIIHFPLSKRVGFTATPISAKKTEPLNKYYQAIVIIEKPSGLIKLNEIKPDRGIVPCLAYSLGKVDRSKFKIKGDEFDEDSVSEEFSKDQQIQNTINAILKHAYNKKIICFNADIEHSLKMHKACLEAGLNSKHLDGKKSGQYGNDKYRENCFKWFHETPNAILHNVGIATTGFDEPSTEVVVLNSSMMSLSLHIQKMVRVSRPYIYPDGSRKEYGLILDMGRNIPHDGGNLHDYNYDWDWEFIFNNPKKKIDGGVGMVKSCPECGALNPISARYCNGKLDDGFEGWLSMDDQICMYEFPVPKGEEDLIPKEMVRVGDGVDVAKNIEFFADRHEYYSYIQTIKQICNKAKIELDRNYLDCSDLNNLFDITYDKCSEWYKIKSKKRPPHYKEDLKYKMIQFLREIDFIIIPEEFLSFTGKEELSNIDESNT